MDIEALNKSEVRGVLTPEMLAGSASVQISRHDIYSEFIPSDVVVRPDELIELPCQEHPFAQELGSALDIHVRSKLGQAGVDLEHHEFRDGKLYVTLSNKSGGDVSLHPGARLAIGNPFTLSDGQPITGNTLKAVLSLTNRRTRHRVDPFHEPSLAGPRDFNNLNHDSIALPVTQYYRRRPAESPVPIQDIPSGTDRERIHAALLIEQIGPETAKQEEPHGLAISSSPQIRLPGGIVLAIQEGSIIDESGFQTVRHGRSLLLKPTCANNGNRYDHPIIFETESKHPDYVFCYAYPYEVVDLAS